MDRRTSLQWMLAAMALPELTGIAVAAPTKKGPGYGTDPVLTVRTNRFSCSARLCLTCHTMTGGTSRSVRVRKTAVPGTRGMGPSAIFAMNAPTGITAS